VKLAALRATYAPLVQQHLTAQIQAIQVPALKAAMAHLLGRGKLFRPLLTLAAYHALAEADAKPHIPLITPLEMIHTFTLIHDDLPCMDDADLRRGVPAVHHAHGEALAVLAGDALLNWALYLVATTPTTLPAQTRLALVQAATRATAAVVEGQVLDLQGEGANLDIAELERVYRLKTGALFGACLETAGALAGQPDDRCEQLRELGEHLGIAFQVRDDLLSIESTEAQAGKTLSTDEAKQKSTYPRALGIAAAKQELETRLNRVQAEISSFGFRDPAALQEIVEEAGQRTR